MNIPALRELTEMIVYEPLIRDIVDAQIAHLRRIFETALGGTFDDLPHTNDPLSVPHGALTAFDSADLCLSDPLRTHAIMKATGDAIEEARKRFPGKCIHLLDPTAGPFAATTLPFATIYPPSDLQITALNIGRDSDGVLRRVVTSMGLQSSFRTIELADATRYVLKEPVHVAVVEAMAKGLMYEPQAQITAQLAPQVLERDGIFLPQNVAVFGSLSPDGAPKRIFDLNSKKLPSSLTVHTIFQVPPSAAERSLKLFLLIHLFGKIFMGTDVSLCSPFTIFKVPPTNAEQLLHLTYDCGSRFADVQVTLSTV